jgi:hypothetical protein
MAQLDTNAIIEIVAALLPVVVKYGAAAVEQVHETFVNDPNLAAQELGAAIKARLDEVAAKDAVILQEKQ